jgi:hypothetical protein
MAAATARPLWFSPPDGLAGALAVIRYSQVHTDAPCTAVSERQIREVRIRSAIR